MQTESIRGTARRSVRRGAKGPDQIRKRVSSLGQTQYIPPGRSSDLMTLVATIAVPQAGQYLPVNCACLSVRLDRAVLLIFSANGLPSQHLQDQVQNPLTI